MLKSFLFGYFFFSLKKKYLPVAQLDSASDSDSEGHEFESHRVGQVESLDTQYRVPRFFAIFMPSHAKGDNAPRTARGALC